MTEKLRAVHYINQFYGQLGGEDMADVGFSVKEGPVGPGALFAKALGDRGEVVATIICGDNYFASKPEEASEELIKLVEKYAPDLFFAGPAFAAGRYGIACGQACKAVGAHFKIPVVSGMYEENPGVDLYRPHAYIVKTGDNAAKMGEVVAKMVRIAFNVLDNTHGEKFVSGFGIGTPEEEGYFPQMVVRNVYMEKSAAARSVDMLLARIHGTPFTTEMPYAEFDKLVPAKPVPDIRKARIAVVSDGGLVDKDNKGQLKTRCCSVWTTYDLDEFFAPDKTAEDFYVAHMGYYGDDVIADRNRMVPYDVLSEMERDGEIRTYYVTSGNAGVRKWSTRMGEEIAEALKREGVDGVLLTST